MHAEWKSFILGEVVVKEKERIESVISLNFKWEQISEYFDLIDLMAQISRDSVWFI